MNTDDLAQQLHARATRGEMLSADEQVQLDQWYVRQDQEEAALLARNGATTRDDGSVRHADCGRTCPMNLNSNPTPGHLRELIRKQRDSAGSHILWVKKTGDIELSLLTTGQSATDFEKRHQDMQIRFEAFLAGNEYVGPQAAQDDEWISELFDRLVKEWSRVKGRSDVVSIDPVW